MYFHQQKFIVQFIGYFRLQKEKSLKNSEKNQEALTVLKMVQLKKCYTII